jgi:hypothetical protein
MDAEADNAGADKPQWEFFIKSYQREGLGSFQAAEEEVADTWFLFGKNGDEQRVFGLFESRTDAEKGMEYWDTHRENISPTMKELTQGMKM